MFLGEQGEQGGLGGTCHAEHPDQRDSLLLPARLIYAGQDKRAAPTAVPEQFMESTAKIIIALGLLLVLGGGLMLLLGKFGIHLGQLPGDLHVEGRRSSFHVPIMTCILASIALTLLLNLVLRLWK